MAANSSKKARIVKADSSDAIPDSYLVMLKKTTDKSAHLGWFKSLQKEHPGLCQIEYEYQTVHFYSAILRGDALDKVAQSSDVDEIHQNKRLEQLGNFHHKEISLITEKSTTWNLQRISQEERLPLGSNAHDLSYTYRVEKITNPKYVDVYIIDTGVKIDHNDIKGRVKWGKTFGGGKDRVDKLGHGTAVASIIVGQSLGVCRADKATAIAVKCARPDETTNSQDAIEAIEWVIEQVKITKRRSIINFCLGGKGYLAGLDEVMLKALLAGIHVCAAAGNNGNDVQHSPGRLSLVVTVGASNINDERYSKSNYGPHVDLFAPGEDVPHAGLQSEYDVALGEGTSVAAPHVTGVMAHILSKGDNMTPAELHDKIVGMAIEGKLQGLEHFADTRNKLLNNGLR